MSPILAALVAGAALLATVLAARAGRVVAAWPGLIAFGALALGGPLAAEGLALGPLRAAIRYGLEPTLAAAAARRLDPTTTLAHGAPGSGDPVWRRTE